jgi:hypothetical protein
MRHDGVLDVFHEPVCVERAVLLKVVCQLEDALCLVDLLARAVEHLDAQRVVDGEAREGGPDMELLVLHSWAVAGARGRWREGVEDGVLLVHGNEELEAEGDAEVEDAADEEEAPALGEGHRLEGIGPVVRDKGEEAGQCAEPQLDVAHEVVLGKVQVVEGLRKVEDMSGTYLSQYVPTAPTLQWLCGQFWGNV